MVASCDGGDACSGIFPNYHEGLCWSDPFLDTMNWSDANTHCQNLGGRLPTISELRTLIQNCPATQTGGSCGVTDSCLSSYCRDSSCDGCSSDSSGKYNVFGHTGWFWSSSAYLYNADFVWYVLFINGDVLTILKSYTNYAMCVRLMAEPQ